MLRLDEKEYLWEYAKGIGDLLLFAKQEHPPLSILSKGTYKIYDVKNEPEYVDLQHLELSVGNNTWQGYLLLTGLPNARKIRSKFVPTNEIISVTLHNEKK